jgi:nitrite reductase/ring-hydroxylating ferredoxin subunit
MINREWAVAKLGALADPGALEFSVGNGDWPFRGFLVRQHGKVYAYTNVCPHQRHPLNLTPNGFFSVDKTALLCASHGATFKPETGECIGGPCVGKSLTQVATRIEDEIVYVTAPDAQVTQ